MWYKPTKKFLTIRFLQQPIKTACMKIYFLLYKRNYNGTRNWKNPITVNIRLGIVSKKVCNNSIRGYKPETLKSYSPTLSRNRNIRKNYSIPPRQWKILSAGL